LTTNRPYRKALSTAAALATMRSEARQGAYAPAILEQFVGLLPSRAVPSPAWPARPVSNRIAKFPVRRQAKAGKPVRARSARAAIA
jgi:HD-GYP domain-containing protein (c-di-GMP phosphodiesterase class II)